jgi:uncharacterized membrane protein
MNDLEQLQGPDRRFLPRRDWPLVVISTIGVLIVTGLAVLWPRDRPAFDRAALGFADSVVRATVTEVYTGACSFAAELECRAVVFETDDGDVATQEFDDHPTAPTLAVGDRVVLNVVEEADPLFRYHYADRDRRGILVAVALVFGLAVVGLGRVKGLAALGGLAVSVGILMAFVAPAILAGSEPVLVASVGGAAIAFSTLYLAHGWRKLTHVAVMGTFLALALTMALSFVVAWFARFSGFASEESLYLALLDGVQVSGLVLAGTVLGAIGALDDVTVTQVSAVFEIGQANPGMSEHDLYRAGLRVGRDHIASTVNTLLLAYAGAAMPLLLLLSLSELPLTAIANSEVVAIEIVRTLVGSIGLVASVPITTWLAARMVATSSRADYLGLGSTAEEVI